MTMTRVATMVLYSAVLAGSLAVAVPKATAQSCAMCYQNAAATGAEGKLALQRGILILAVPAIGLFVGILLLLYSRRNLRDRASLAQDYSQTVLCETSFAKSDFVVAELPCHSE